MQVVTAVLVWGLLAAAPASNLEARRTAYDAILRSALDARWDEAFRRTQGQVQQPKDQIDRFETVRKQLWALRDVTSLDGVKALPLEAVKRVAFALHRLLLVFHAAEVTDWRKLSAPTLAAYRRALELAPGDRTVLAAEAALHYKLGDKAQGDRFTPPPPEEWAPHELPMMLTWATAKGDRKELAGWLRAVSEKHPELVRWWAYESDSVNAFRSDPEIAGLLGAPASGWPPDWKPLEIWRDQLVAPEGSWAVDLTACYAPAEERERLVEAARALSTEDALPVAEGALLLAEHLKKRGVTSWEKVGERAVKAADRGLAKVPDEPSLSAVRGVALYLLGHTAEAARALASPPPPASVGGENAFRLARYFALQKNLEKLTAYFEAAVSHDPERAKQWFETADEVAEFRQEPELLAAVARASQKK